MSEYTKQLFLALEKYPEDYAFTTADIPNVLIKMRHAFRVGTYNKNGRAIKATCKAFKIAHTYKAINHFIINHA